MEKNTSFLNQTNCMMFETAISYFSGKKQITKKGDFL